MKIEYDPAKREWTIRNRALDFEAASEVFAGDHSDEIDTRRTYGEERHISYGLLNGRVVVVVWTMRQKDGLNARRIISMRKANEREATIFRNRFPKA